jgi:hypothetical protein
VDFSNDVETQDTAAPKLLDNVRLLVEHLREQEHLITEAEAHLKRLQDGHNRLTLELIPEAMASVGLAEVKLEDGAVLRVRDDVKVYINKDNAVDAYAWLRTNGLGSIIRSNLEVDLRAVADPEDLIKTLTQDGVECHVKEDVHAATLKASIRAMLERGVTPPAAISVHQFKKADIKEPRK